MIEGYQISTDMSEMDIKVIHGFISNSHWAKNIPIHTMTKAVENSLCFGVFTESAEQIGFARIISDYATFAYLSDVFILEEHRGKGLSKWLISVILEHPELQGLRRISLTTRDARLLYEKFGFTILKQPERFLELHHPNIYIGEF